MYIIKLTSHVTELTLASYHNSCHFHTVACKTDDILHPQCDHFEEHKSRTKYVLMQTNTSLINGMLVEGKV
jgi:hypothetical protein